MNSCPDFKSQEKLTLVFLHLLNVTLNRLSLIALHCALGNLELYNKLLTMNVEYLYKRCIPISNCL